LATARNRIIELLAFVSFQPPFDTFHRSKWRILNPNLNAANCRPIASHLGAQRRPLAGVQIGGASIPIMPWEMLRA
jgi:hypothetical protein